MKTTIYECAQKLRRLVISYASSDLTTEQRAVILAAARECQNLAGDHMFESEYLRDLLARAEALVKRLPLR